MPGDKQYIEELDKYIESSQLSNIEMFENFAKYIPRWSLMRFLTKYEMFKRILDVEGVIIEAGVYHGGGLMSWAQLSSILEPYNHQRHVIGFDTFEGFTSLAKQDGKESSKFKKVGAWSSASYDDLRRCAEIHDITRPMGQIPKVYLVPGDIMETAERFIKENPQTVVSLLYLDVDLYEPTKKMLEIFGPRMVKGSIIAFDQINTPAFPGETLAVDEILGISNLEIKRFPFGTSISYAVL
ncbi:MAG: class I SAM-dependent methyltransferase [Chloroflexi bacterium]|nr:class I SAM-dependent methyltransferase [Chloroflexota bacterium]